MKVLFCGDIVGRSGREAVTKNVPRLRQELGLDFVVVNGENAAAGFGITAKICAELHSAGVDCITTGNHVWDQRDIIPYIAQDKRLLRPVNFPPGTPGWGANLFETTRGHKIVVVNVMCRLFMEPLDNTAFAERIAALPLARQPGTLWRYGHSTDVLGRIIEIVSGQTLGQFEQQRILSQIPESDLSEDQKTQRLNEAVIAITRITLQAVQRSIASIRTPTALVSEGEHILEFLEQCDRNIYSAIREKAVSLRGMDDFKPVEVSCPSCEHHYEQKFSLDSASFFDNAS